MRDPNRAASLRAVIEEYLEKRLSDKVKTGKQKQEELAQRYELRYWVGDAAQRASRLKLKLATHVIKATHQDARGTNLYCPPHNLPRHNDVGTGALHQIEPDVVCNSAAALDVYAFLSLQFEEKSILRLMEDQDEDLLALLADSEAEALSLVNTFLQIKEVGKSISSSTLAKQVYWLVGNNPSDNSQFHLLAPLYASSLTQHIYQSIQEAQIGEIRKLRKKNQYSELPSADYKNMAVQKLGGSKPQNISKLNSTRNGINYLLASGPPLWAEQSRLFEIVYYRTSILESYELHKEVGDTLLALRKFLESDPPSIRETRDRRDRYLQQISQGVLSIACEISSLEPGWSRDKRCRLPDSEKLWLDPERASDDVKFADARASSNWQTTIAKSFASWILKQLEQKLPLSDVEHIFLGEVFEEELLNQGTPVALVH